MPQKILIVDDEEDILSMLEMRLQANGYDVVSAKDGIEGLEQVKNHTPDLIITDVLMPRMDGFEFYKQLKTTESMNHIPVLVLTARGKMEDTFAVMGVDDFITKPFSPNDLLTKVRCFLEKAPEKKTPEEEKAKPAVEPAKNSQPEEVVEVLKSGMKIYKVLLIGSSLSVIEDIDQYLTSVDCQVETVQKADQVVDVAEILKPDIVILDVLVENKPANNIVANLKKIPDLKTKPVILFSFLDKDKLGENSVHQRAMKIDRAKTACMDAGATETIGGFQEEALQTALNKYLS